METVYIESTIPSYLTAKPNNNVIATARQLATQRWWNERKVQYDLYTSDVVLIECNKGNSEAAEKRISSLEGIPLLEVSEEALELAAIIFKELQIPEKARDDALHIAIACVNEIDYLMSWNFKHLVNATMIRKLNRLLERTIYKTTQICTPEELTE